MSRFKIRIGTRKSKLALWQAKTVANKLKEIGYESSIISLKSDGDINLTQPLYSYDLRLIDDRNAEEPSELTRIRYRECSSSDFVRKQLFVPGSVGHVSD